MDAGSRALLDAIHAEQRAWGEEVPPPATDDELAALTAFVRQHAGTDPPAGYLGFLRVANGLDADGTTVYATGFRRRPDGTVQLGLPDQNLAFREGPGPVWWLLLGERGDDLFAVDVRSGGGRVLDRVSLDALEEFADADALLHHVLRAAARR